MPTRWSVFAVVALLLGGCSEEGAAAARVKVRKEHAGRVAKITREDLARHEAGLRRAADRIAAGFVKVTGEQQEREVRQVLKLLRSPKKGVQELVISPLSFIAAVDTNGIVIARDTEPDPMKGMDLGKLFPSVKQALAGTAATEIGQFESLNEGGKPSVTIVMAAPAHYDRKVVGALVLGMPLWRLQQRLSKQLQMEEAGKKPGTVIWVYVYRGDELHFHGTPSGFEELLPDAKARQAGLAKSPGGFTGQSAQHGFWYGWGVKPLPFLGENTGAIVVRMDPQ